MLKIKNEIELEELLKHGFEIDRTWGISTYEKMYRKISYIVTTDRVIHKLKDIGYYTDELKMTKQDIKRLGIADLVEKV